MNEEASVREDDRKEQFDVPPLLKWSRELHAIAQSGLAYDADPYDAERFQRLLEISREILSDTTEEDSRVIRDLVTIGTGYATPKIDVRGAVIREGKILLVKERTDGMWAMPGGWADVGHRPSEMVAREVEEESGYRVTPMKLIGLYDANRIEGRLDFFHAYKLVFLCEFDGGTPAVGYETLDVGFFGRDELPPLSIRRTNREQIEMAYRAAADLDLPAYFD